MKVSLVLLSFLVAVNSGYQLGEVYSFVSQNYPTYSIGVRSNKNAAIIQGTDKKFEIVAALNGRPGAVSLKSIDGEINYLRHQGYVVKEHKYEGSQLFRDDASFYVREDKYFPGYSAFESTNYPGNYIRHFNYLLLLNQPKSKKNGVAIFQKDASFKFVKAEQGYQLGKVYSFVSQNYPKYSIGVRSNKNAAIIQGTDKKFEIVAALNGRPRAVSLKSIDRDYQITYLRHQNFVVKEHQNDGSQLFRDDASFYVREDKYFPGYSAFESTNYPGYYIRHYNYLLLLNQPTSKKNGVAIFQKDASFKFVNAEQEA